MNNKDDNGLEPESKTPIIRAKAISHFVTIGVFLVALFASSTILRDFRGVWFASIWAYWSLAFSSLTIAVCSYYLVSSLFDDIMAEAGQYYSIDDGKAMWHIRWAYRLGAISMLGHSAIFLACGWMYKSDDCRPWDYFGFLLVTGFAAIMTSHLCAWYRHKPMRKLTVQSWALANIFLFSALIFLIALGVYEQFYIDVIGVLLVCAASSTLAHIFVSVRHQHTLQKAMKANITEAE